MMRRTLLTAAVFATLVAGCSTYQPLRDTTQPGKLRKSAFNDGSKWYMLTTVIKAPFEAAFTNPGETTPMTKIKWVIEEHTLYAYKTYEEVQGAGLAAGKGSNYLGQPVAAYAITDQLDVWHQYNPTTGEELPVLYESHERPWWQREWMRVDWSKNLIGAGQYMSEDFCKWSGDVVEDPVSYFPTQPTDPDQFYVGVKGKTDKELGQGMCQQVGDWCNVHGWKNIEKLKHFDYIDVVNQDFIHYNAQSAFNGTASTNCWPYPVWPIDEGIQVTKRVSFLKVPKSDYKPLPYPDATWEKFGFFRTIRDTFDQRRRVTDFKTYYANRWDLWKHVTDASGKTIPIPQRQLNPITYYYIPTAQLDSTKYCAKSGADCIPFMKDSLYRDVATEWNDAWRGVLKAAGFPDAKDQTVFQVRPIDYKCGYDGKQPCERLGDLRYSFMWNHDQSSDNGLLGYGPAFTDPETGQIIAATANLYGGNLGSYEAGLLGDYYDLIKGNTTDLQIETGENVRQYFQNLGGVVGPPALPQIDFTAMTKIEQEAKTGKLDPTNPSDLSFQQLQLKRELDNLKREAPRDADRLSMFQDTPIEKMLITPEFLQLMGEDPSESLTENVLNRVSPFRAGSRFHQLRDRWDTFWAEHNVFMADGLWNDPTVEAMVKRAEQVLGAGATKDQVIEYILQRTWVGTAAHETGHTFGLMHNFEGSTDEQNYHPQYWAIIKQHPEVKLGTVGDNGTITSTWDTNHDGKLDGEEYAAYEKANNAAHLAEQKAGSDLYSTSSIMDYNGVSIIASDVAGVGRYDEAALKYGYAGTIELYSNDQSQFDPAAVKAAGGWSMFKFEKDNRIDVPYYAGGQTCTDDTQCPMNDHPEVPQHCRADLGQGAILHNGTKKDLGVCSSIYFELETDANDPAKAIPYPAFRYCSDYRLNDKPFCNMFDTGDSAVQITQNLIDQYQRDYIFRNFRRYRDGFQPYFYYQHLWSRVFVPIGKFHQSLLYNYYYKPGYAQDLGPGGMLDTFLASRMGLNFFAQVLATPDVGSYIKFDPSSNSYQGGFTEKHAAWADLYVPLGTGKYLYSAFEQGELGQLYRYARIGTFYDKLFALEALTTRDWGLPQANDETFPIDYYDAYKPEMLKLFAGIIADNPATYGPIIKGVDTSTGTVTKLQYRDIWQGDFFGSQTADFPGLQAVSGYANPPNYSNDEFLNPGGSVYIKLYALVYALSDFPVFYNFEFQNYVQLYTYGSTSADNGGALQNDPNVVSFTSPTHGVTYATEKPTDGVGLFVPLIEKAKTEASTLQAYQALEQSGPPANFLANHQICVKVLGSATTNAACLTYLINYTKQNLDSSESFLDFSKLLLNEAGFPMQ